MTLEARRRVALLAVLCAACSRSASGPVTHAVGDLAEGVVATVQGESIAAASITRIAQARNLAPSQALDVAISDALLAAHGAVRASYAERLASSRVLLEQFRAEAEAVGIPRAEELDLAKQRRWWELDRPEMRRVVHVVVVFDEDTDHAAAKAHAQKIYQAVKGAPNGVEFRARANSVEKAGFHVELQDLRPMTADGRALEVSRYNAPGTQPEQYHEEFSRPIFQLTGIDQMTPLFESPSGYHVALLLQIIPELRLSTEEIRRTLTEEIYDARTRGILQTFLSAAKQRMKPEIALDFETLTNLTLAPSTTPPPVPAPEP